MQAFIFNQTKQPEITKTTNAVQGRVIMDPVMALLDKILPSTLALSKMFTCLPHNALFTVSAVLADSVQSALNRLVNEWALWTCPFMNTDTLITGSSKQLALKVKSLLANNGLHSLHRFHLARSSSLSLSPASSRKVCQWLVLTKRH